MLFLAAKKKKKKALLLGTDEKFQPIPSWTHSEWKEEIPHSCLSPSALSFTEATV